MNRTVINGPDGSPRFSYMRHPSVDYWAVYYMREDGIWEWWADCRTEKIARITAKHLATPGVLK